MDLEASARLVLVVASLLLVLALTGLQLAGKAQLGITAAIGGAALLVLKLATWSS